MLNIVFVNICLRSKCYKTYYFLHLFIWCPLTAPLSLSLSIESFVANNSNNKNIESRTRNKGLKYKKKCVRNNSDEWIVQTHTQKERERFVHKKTIITRGHFSYILNHRQTIRSEIEGKKRETEWEVNKKKCGK